jgi:hypothetical protein
MVIASEEALLSTVDRVYEVIERPELWPKTIYAIGELIWTGKRSCAKSVAERIGLFPGDK